MRHFCPLWSGPVPSGWFSVKDISEERPRGASKERNRCLRLRLAYCSSVRQPCLIFK